MSSPGVKKAYETESFTGILHEEVQKASMERGDDLAWGGDVVEELPEEAVAYEEDGNQKGQILKKPQIFQKPQGDWKSESGQVGVIYGVVCDCLVSV